MHSSLFFFFFLLTVSFRMFVGLGEATEGVDVPYPPLSAVETELTAPAGKVFCAVAPCATEPNRENPC